MTRQTPYLLALFYIGLIHSASAEQFMPTPAQIEQFKSLSPAEQQQMAAAAGVDLKALNLGGSNAAPTAPAEPEAQGRLPAAKTVKNSDEDSDEEELEGSDKEGDKEGDRDIKPPKKTPKTDEKNGDNSNNLSLFGRDLFENDLEAFRPASNMPIPADYVMGPGDTVVLQLYGKESASYTLAVSREGQIQFPKIGPITLAGLTFSEAQKLINDVVEQQMIGVKASVTMGALRSIRIFVLGEVARPGSFAVGALSTMTNGLFMSGGITNVGSLRKIQLKRQGSVVTSLDLYDLLLNGDTSKDSRLQPGDVIFVPPIGKTVSISGEIKRPAMYEIDQNANIEQLIELSGGLKNTAYLPISYLVRHDAFGEKTLFNINLTESSGMQKPLEDGDRLSIASKLNFVNNQVGLVGHVKRTGPRSWKQGLRFTDLIPTARDLLPNPDIEMALIQRFSSETRRVEVILFSPRNAWERPGSDADPILQGSDEIRVFNYEEQRSKLLTEVVTKLGSQSRFDERRKVVSISGSVRFPGSYPLAKDMTTKELIYLAGGLTESALDSNGEITRYGIDDQRQRLVTHVAVNAGNDIVALEPGDTLQIKQIPLWKAKETIELTGEVMFPGTYSILPGETLMEVLKRAGGLSHHAYPLGTIFSRKELRELEQQRLTELKGTLKNDMAAANAKGETTGVEKVADADMEKILKSLDTIKPLGRMVINLPLIIDSPEKHDFQLEDGDVISIPRYKPSVTVVGEVQYPTSHFFSKAQDAIGYIEYSGGFKKHADERRVYIVRADGSVTQPQTSGWFKAKSDAIRPGDTIVVPLETEQVDKLSVWAKATTIIYQAALGAAAVKSL